MPRAGLTADIMLDRAAAIADAEGLPAVTIARLAAAFGVKPPSLYKHVANLEAVERALAVRGLTTAGGLLAAATAGKTRDAALLALATAYRAFAQTHPGLYAASLRPIRRGENDLARAGEQLVGTLQAVLADYRLGRDDAVHAARGLRAIIHGFVSLEAAGAFKLNADAGETLRRLVLAFADSLPRRTP